MTTKEKPTAPEDASQSASLNAALLAAQVALPMVKKDATNDFHKYNYASAEGMIAACREVLHAQGLTAHRIGWSMIPPNGSAIDYGGILSEMVMVHVPSGQQLTANITWPIVPEKGRPMDKAIAGALTSSLSYWLRDLLMVPREEEGMDNRNDTTYTPPNPTQVLPPLKKKDAPTEPPAAKNEPTEKKEDPDLSAAPSKARKALLALMQKADVTVDEIEKVAVMNGMVKKGTSFDAFDDECLQRFETNWERVTTIIESKVRA